MIWQAVILVACFCTQNRVGLFLRCNMCVILAHLHFIYQPGLIIGLSFQSARPAGNQEVTPSNLTSRRAKIFSPSSNKPKAGVCYLLLEISFCDYISNNIY